MMRPKCDHIYKLVHPLKCPSTLINIDCREQLLFIEIIIIVLAVDRHPYASRASISGPILARIVRDPELMMHSGHMAT